MEHDVFTVTGSKMTKYQIFKKVSLHLLKQGVQSIDSSEGCLYRHETENRKCAIGCLIPDALYKKEMEGSTVDTLVDDYPEVLKHITGSEDLEKSNDVIDLLYDLQAIHDTERNWEGKGARVKIQLISCAKKYKIDYSFLADKEMNQKPRKTQ